MLFPELWQAVRVYTSIPEQESFVVVFVSWLGGEKNAVEVTKNALNISIKGVL